MHVHGEPACIRGEPGKYEHAPACVQVNHWTAADEEGPQRVEHHAAPDSTPHHASNGRVSGPHADTRPLSDSAAIARSPARPVQQPHPHPAVPVHGSTLPASTDSSGSVDALQRELAALTSAHAEALAAKQQLQQHVSELQATVDDLRAELGRQAQRAQSTGEEEQTSVERPAEERANGLQEELKQVCL